MAKSKTSNDLSDVNQEIKRVRENHHVLAKKTEKITDKLRTESDRAGEERHRANVKNNSVKKTQKATEELRKLKDLSDEEINSLTSERNDSIEGKIAFELEYVSNKEELRTVEEELCKIHAEYKELEERTDKRTAQLVVERDIASDERYWARVRCDEVRKKIIQYENMIEKAHLECNNLKEHSDEMNNSLIAERDQYEDESRLLNEEYDKNTVKLDLLNRKYEGDTLKSQHANSTKMDIRQASFIEQGKGNDSGIQIDISPVRKEMQKQIEVMIDEKLGNLGETKRHTAEFTEPKREKERKIPCADFRANTMAHTRDLNIIVHGVDESKEADDEVYMKKLFSITGMDHTSPTLAHRLGIRKVDRSRPLRITMESRNLKAEFMSKLWKLRYAEEEYKKIRVTDDFTFEEREEIRQWVEMAKNKNEEENNENGIYFR